MKCPDCKGKKVIFGFGCGRGVCLVPMTLPCPRCNGIGKVPGIMKEWIKTGGKYRKRRILRSISIRERADQLGIDPSTLIRMELGYIKPDVRLLKRVGGCK
jgi:hypothetical protein